MVVFDDAQPAYKVTVYDKSFQLKQSMDTYADWISMRQGDIITPRLDATEPLLREARDFIECIQKNHAPLADGAAGLLNVSVLEYGQRSLETSSVVAITPPHRRVANSAA